MAFIVIPEGARLQVRATYQGQECENTFTYTHSFGWGQDELDELTEAVATAWAGSMLAQLNTEYHFREVYARGEREPVDFESVNSAHAGDGADASDPLPGNVAFTVSRRTGLAGRSARGRVYIYGLGIGTLLTANIIKAANAADIVDALETVRAAAALADWTEVIASIQTDGVANNPAVVRAVSQYSTVDLNLDSQRRRLNGRGA